MTRMMTWTLVLLAGIGMVAAVPLIPETAAAFGSGFFPEWLIPAGFVVASLGATGMLAAWMWKRGVNHD